MVAALQKKISESATARWSVLALVAFTMLCGYFITDVMAPLKNMLETQMAWDSSDYGFFTSAYGWFNVFLLMLIFGGMILDKMGVRFTGLMSTIIMVVGVGIKYWAIASDFGGSVVHIFGVSISTQVLWASIGYAIFGVGIEIAGITVSKIIVKWFKGKELALAMGLEMACARIGTALALGVTPMLAEHFQSVSMPILLGLLLLCIGMISFVVFVVMDSKRDQELKETAAPEEPFRFRDIFDIIKLIGHRSKLMVMRCKKRFSANFFSISYIFKHGSCDAHAIKSGSSSAQPLCWSTISFTTERPTPRPPVARARPESARQNRWNTIFASSGVRPMPVSRTLIWPIKSPLRAVMVMVPPSGV